jgi:hypothetical protein
MLITGGDPAECQFSPGHPAHRRRGRVELVPGIAHANHRETPEAFTGLLTQFIADLG